MKARITLIGTENYLNKMDKSIADEWTGIVDPAGLYDSNNFLNALLMRVGQLEIRTGDPVFFTNMSTFWWRKWLPTFNRWLYALSIKYAPLENYDRHEQVDETRDNTDKTKESTVFGEKYSGSNTSHSSGSSNTSGSDNGTTETKQSGFNSSSYEPLSHVGTTNGNTSESHDTNDGNGSESHSTDTTNKFDHDNTNNDIFAHTAYIHGNIGVTTSQEMLKAELDLGYWNLYNRMADMFANELLVRVW